MVRGGCSRRGTVHTEASACQCGPAPSVAVKVPTATGTDRPRNAGGQADSPGITMWSPPSRAWPVSGDGPIPGARRQRQDTVGEIDEVGGRLGHIALGRARAGRRIGGDTSPADQRTPEVTHRLPRHGGPQARRRNGKVRTTSSWARRCHRGEPPGHVDGPGCSGQHGCPLLEIVCSETRFI